MTGEQIISVARAAVGIPFRHQGRSDAGLDCAGLVVRIAAAIGADYVDVSGYSRRPSNGVLQNALDMQPCLERIYGEPQPGDVLLMRFTGEPQHLAILAGQTIIHALLQSGKVSEHDFDDLWKSRVVRVYRFRGVA